MENNQNDVDLLIRGEWLAEVAEWKVRAKFASVVIAHFGGTAMEEIARLKAAGADLEFITKLCITIHFLGHILNPDFNCGPDGPRHDTTKLMEVKGLKILNAAITAARAKAQGA